MKGKHRYRVWLWSASVFGVLCFIFANSLTPASQSAEESRSFLSGFLSLFPSITHHVVRKLAHVAEYALLGFHLSFAPMLFSRRIALSLTLGFGVLAALADEGIQTMVPGRGASFNDVLIDVLGYFAALFIMLVFFFVVARKRKEKAHG